jgi:hypothetical protein
LIDERDTHLAPPVQTFSLKKKVKHQKQLAIDFADQPAYRLPSDTVPSL